MPNLPKYVRVVEVGPRDGLQNESAKVSTVDKLAMITGLVEAGLESIEVASFVNPARVPQMGDATEVIAGLPHAPNVTYSALVPNMKGLERAIATGVKRIAVFTAASETFTQKNIGVTIAESLTTFGEVVRAARAAGMSVRGYVSTSFVCPYEGEIAPSKVRDVTESLLAIGCDEVAISDTIGAASPEDVLRVLALLLEKTPVTQIALHMHDTYGTALANVYAGLQLGVTTFDSSLGGLGGCPFAPGAAGNLATEDLVYMLERMGIRTGVNMDRLIAAARRIQQVIGRELPSRQLRRCISAPSASR